MPEARAVAEQDLPHIEQLVLTREFTRRYSDLSPFARKHCARALERLLTTPRNPAVSLRPLVSPAGYYELRVGHRDRAVLRIEGASAVLVDVASFREVARLSARASRCLRFERRQVLRQRG